MRVERAVEHRVLGTVALVAAVCRDVKRRALSHGRPPRGRVVPTRASPFGRMPRYPCISPGHALAPATHAELVCFAESGVQILSPRLIRRKRRSNKGNARPRGGGAHQVPSAWSVKQADGAPQIACGRVHVALGDGQRAVAGEHAHGFDRGASPDKLAQKCVPLIPRAE